MPHRVHVEQPLRRMRMASVPRVDDVNVGRDMLRDEMGRAAFAVAHDEHVRVHGREIVDGVEQALALALRRRADIEIDDVGRQALGRDLEGGPGAGRWLEEEVEHRLPAQQRHFLDFDPDERLGGIQNLPEDLGRQALECEEMVELPLLVELRIRGIEPHYGLSSFRTKAKRPFESRVSSRLSPCRSATAAPTKSAAIGNCRPPRSTRAASCTRPGRP